MYCDVSVIRSIDQKSHTRQPIQTYTCIRSSWASSWTSSRSSSRASRTRPRAPRPATAEVSGPAIAVASRSSYCIDCIDIYTPIHVYIYTFTQPTNQPTPSHPSIHTAGIYAGTLVLCIGAYAYDKKKKARRAATSALLQEEQQALTGGGVGAGLGGSYGA